MTQNPAERPDGFSALPKRFKDYIAQLERAIHTLESQVPARRMMNGQSIKVVDRLHEGNDGFLPDDTEFEFHIKGAVFRIKRASPHHGIEGIEINTEFGVCVVYPRVSNVVVIGSARP